MRPLSLNPKKLTSGRSGSGQVQVVLQIAEHVADLPGICPSAFGSDVLYIPMHTHKHIHIYISIYIYVCTWYRYHVGTTRPSIV